VEDQANPPFVTVVNKLDEDEHALRKAVTAAINSRLPALNRGLNLFTERVLRVYLQDFVEQHWVELQEPGREPDLAHLLARRLAVSLEDGAGLDRELTNVPGPDPESLAGTVHPMRMYVIPPIGDWTTGDILQSAMPPSAAGMYKSTPRCSEEANSSENISHTYEADDVSPSTSTADDQHHGEAHAATRAPSQVGSPSSMYWVMLTPACDLVGGRVKAEYVVLATCQPLAEEIETTAWTVDINSASKRKKLDALLKNNRSDHQADRFHALPPVWDIPGLLVDFQRITHIPYDQLTLFTRLGTLDDPYAQELIARFGRYVGRLGTPDIDLQVVRERLKGNT